MQFSALLLASLICLLSLAQAVPSALDIPNHESPVLQVRKERDLQSPPHSPPRTSPPPRAGRSSPLPPEFWQRILARLHDRTGGLLIDGTVRGGQPLPGFTSASRGNPYTGLTRILRVRPQPHSPQSHSPPRPHLKPRAPKNADLLPPATSPSRNPPRITPTDGPAAAHYILRPASPSHTPLPGRIALQPTTSGDEEFWRFPGPYQQNAPAPRSGVAQVPSSLRQQDLSPTLPRAHQGAGRSQNSNPGGVPGFNPIDHAAAEFPLLHSRSAKPWTSMANIPAPPPAEHAPARIDDPLGADTLRQRYHPPTPPAAAHEPILRGPHAAGRLSLPNPNGNPAFNPIDAPAAEYPLLHARSPKQFVLDSPRAPSTAVAQGQAPVSGPPLAPQLPYIPPQNLRQSPPQHSNSRSRFTGSSTPSASSSSGSESGESALSINTDSTQVFNVITCRPHPRQGVRCEQYCECNRLLTVNCSRYMRRCPTLCHCSYSQE